MDSMDIIRFEESFDRQQNAVERRKAGQFYTRRSTRIKLCAVGKRKVKLNTPCKTNHKTKQVTKSKTDLKTKQETKSKKTDKRIKRPVYLRPIKAPKKKNGMLNGGKSERFKKRSEERRNKLQRQTYFEASDSF